MAFRAVIRFSESDRQALAMGFQQHPDVYAAEMRRRFGIWLRDVNAQAVVNFGNRFTTRSGNAARAIAYEVNGDGMGGVVFLDEGIAKYPKFLHEGTGVFGDRGRPFQVFAKPGKALRFAKPGGGGFAFARKVTIKGIHGDPFLMRAFEGKIASLEQSLEQGLQDAAKQAGFT